MKPFGPKTSSLETEPEMEILVQVTCGGMLWRKGLGQQDRAERKSWLRHASFILIPGSQEPIYTTESLPLARGQPSYHQLLFGWGWGVGLLLPRRRVLRAILWTQAQLWVIGSQRSQRLRDGCTRLGKGNLENGWLSLKKTYLEA